MSAGKAATLIILADSFLAAKTRGILEQKRLLNQIGFLVQTVVVIPLVNAYEVIKALDVHMERVNDLGHDAVDITYGVSRVLVQHRGEQGG